MMQKIYSKGRYFWRYTGEGVPRVVRYQVVGAANQEAPVGRPLDRPELWEPTCREALEGYAVREREAARIKQTREAQQNGNHASETPQAEPEAHEGTGSAVEGGGSDTPATPLESAGGEETEEKERLFLTLDGRPRVALSRDEMETILDGLDSQAHHGLQYGAMILKLRVIYRSVWGEEY